MKNERRNIRGRGNKMDDVKIKVINSDKLIKAINEGSYDVDLSAVMALGSVVLDIKKAETCAGCKHLGKWEDEYKHGYPSPCTGCKRWAEDRYER
jgi:hypothetical protein